jgi:hypothetical protein
MKNRFFHQEKGTTLGPITSYEIKSRVRQGRIRLFDLVYRDGDPTWCMALEHPDLKGEFKTSTVKTLVDRPWVCLQRKSETGFEFGTSGPFSTQDVNLMIQEGLISYSDYVWRDGFGEWRRIGSLEDFNRRLSEARERKDRRGATGPDAMPPLPEIPAQELIKNVVEMKRGETPPPVPPEATTPDLSVVGMIPPPLEKRRKSRPVDKERRTKPADGRPMEEKTAWKDWAIVGVLALAFCAVALTASFQLSSPSDVDNPPSIPAPKPTAAPAAEMEKTLEPPSELSPDFKSVEKADEPNRREIEKSEDKAPTELTLNVQSAGPNQVKIELRTDASGDDYPVYFQVIGLPGQVSDGASYYKFLRLNAIGDHKETIDLSGLDLPQGRFIFRAETGNLKKEAKLNIGVSDAAYKQTMARLRKVHAHAIWRERLELFRLSQVLEKQLADALGGKKFSGKGLEALNGVKRSTGANYVLYDQWFEMKEILTAAKTAPSMALLGRLKQARERLATFSVWK